MKKYKQITHMQELQQKLDKTYGKGFYKAGFVLLLFSCLFFTSCAADSHPVSSARVGAQETSTTTTTTSSSEALIKITDPNQKTTPSKLYGSDPAVLDAYFAREDTNSGSYKRINSAAIGDTVFIVVDTANLNSRTIKVTIKDNNKIIKDKIPFLQYKAKDDTTFEQKPIDVSGEFSTKVRNDKNDKRFALYKIVLKAKEDETTKKWQEEINKHKDKKLKLYLTVTVEGEKVIYCGSNFKDENQRATDKESNVWLNMDKKWFEVSLAMKTYYIYWNTKTEGKIEKYVPKNIIKDAENKYKYIYYDKEGNEHEICTAIWHNTREKKTGIKHDNIPTQDGIISDENIVEGQTRRRISYTNGNIAEYGSNNGKTFWVLYEAKLNDIELVKMPDELNYSNGGISVRYIFSNTERRYTSPGSLAGFIGALAENNLRLTTTGSCFIYASSFPSVEHVNGKSIDTLYLDDTNEQRFINAMHKFNFNKQITGRDKIKFNNAIQETNGTLHNSHLHSGFNESSIIKI